MFIDLYIYLYICVHIILKTLLQHFFFLTYGNHTKSYLLNINWFLHEKKNSVVKFACLQSWSILYELYIAGTTVIPMKILNSKHSIVFKQIKNLSQPNSYLQTLENLFHLLLLNDFNLFIDVGLCPEKWPREKKGRKKAPKKLPPENHPLEIYPQGKLIDGKMPPRKIPPRKIVPRKNNPRKIVLLDFCCC